MKNRLELNLKDKRILFICLKTFEYENYIKSKLEEVGAIVDYFDERPNNSILVKGLIRLQKSLLSFFINKYYIDILEKVKNNNYDFFFLVKGEAIPDFFIKKIKIRNPECKIIYYTWDSFENNRNAQNLLDLFDLKFTFDHRDAIKYQMKLRPLFYIDAYQNIKNSDVDKKYAVLFIGTAHSDRYVISEKIYEWCENNNFIMYPYYFIQSKIVYYYKKLFDPQFGDFDINKLNYKSLKLKDIILLYEKSNAILDINHPNQRGLTMRTFEALGANKKLITTNENIKKYIFYNEKNILVLDRNKLDIDHSFFFENFVKYDSTLMEKMSINGWLYSIFVENEEAFWI